MEPGTAELKEPAQLFAGDGEAGVAIDKHSPDAAGDVGDDLETGGFGVEVTAQFGKELKLGDGDVPDVVVESLAKIVVGHGTEVIDVGDPDVLAVGGVASAVG